jgi:hypothetical protein
MNLQNLIFQQATILNNFIGGHNDKTFTEVWIVHNKKKDILLNVWHNKDYGFVEQEKFYDYSQVDQESLNIYSIEVCLNETSDKKRVYDFYKFSDKYKKEILSKLCGELEQEEVIND